MVEKTLFIADMLVGRDFEAPFLVLNLGRGQTSRGSLYLNVELGDRTGRLPAKVWDDAEAMAARLAEGSVALIRGYMDSYRGAPQAVIREAAPLPEGRFQWSDYLRAAPRPAAEMRAELRLLVEGMADPDYRRLTLAVLEDPEVESLFFSMPAAKNFHHAYLNGLLEHTLSVARLARLLAGHYGAALSADLLLAGAVLHDLGKIWEFTPPPKVDYSTVGRLSGHLVMGAEFIGRKAAAFPDFPREKLELLRHLILSHHGEYEFGAPVRPQILEALALHAIDNLDAKMAAIGEFLVAETGPEGGWTGFHRLLGGHFFRPAKSEENWPPPPEEPEKPLPPPLEEGDEQNGEQDGEAGGDDRAEAAGEAEAGPPRPAKKAKESGREKEPETEPLLF